MSYTYVVVIKAGNDGNFWCYDTISTWPTLSALIDSVKKLHMGNVTIYNLENFPDEAPAGVEDITGSIYNEPDYVFAAVDGDELTYFGVRKIEE